MSKYGLKEDLSESITRYNIVISKKKLCYLKAAESISNELDA